MKKIVIVGNGISGVTAARHIRKLSDYHITIISGESDYFFSRTALMYVYMGHMKFDDTQPYEPSFWHKNKINLKKAWVKKIVSEDKQLLLENGELLSYDKLILATGSKPNKFGWPGENLEGVQGLYTKQDLELLEKTAPNNSICKHAVVVGGGLIGVELAEMLHSRHIPVTFLVRETNFWNGVLPDHDCSILNDHITAHGIDLRLGVNLKEIHSDQMGRVESVEIAETGEIIPCNFVGLTAGVSPQISLAQNSGIETHRGILVNQFFETNLTDIYAIGDCAEQTDPLPNGRRSIEAVWYSGRMMGETIAQTITGNKTPYKPGHWFNSAKFFDIEYQTYGWVGSLRSKPEHELQLHWKCHDNTKGVTLSYNKNDRTFLGINTFGIRMRHEVFNQWLNEKISIEQVIEQLDKAQFDPEFYKSYVNEIQSVLLATLSNSVL